MKKPALLFTSAALVCGQLGALTVSAQTKPVQPKTGASRPAPQQNQQPPQQPVANRPQPSQRFDLTDYGVTIQPDNRLIVVMAALEAAGVDFVPSGQSPSVFRQQVRKDFADLDPELKRRLRESYERAKLKSTDNYTPTPAEQAARYVSLAFALGPVPALESPARSSDLPDELLEVMDFGALVREFYRHSGIEQKLPEYVKAYQAEGENLRQPTAELVRATLSYLHTVPITTTFERIETTAPSTGKKKNQQKSYTMREHERRFFVIPDLLAVPGAINLRNIGDDYYTVVPFSRNLQSSELRRAYLQYVIDPLVIRSSKDIAARREQLKQILTQAGGNASPDVFLTVARSLVAAADTRMEESAKLDAQLAQSRQRLAKATDAAARNAILKEQAAAKTAIEDEAIAQLAEAYERGAVLSFYFAEKLKDVETSSFDIANSLADMINSFDPVRESTRLKENAQARERALAARKARQAQLASTTEAASEESPRRLALIQGLADVDELVRVKSYEEADGRLRGLLKEYQGEPRIFFAMGRVASVSAQDAFDDDLQAKRLNEALINYRAAIQAASPDTDKPLISRAHVAMGRIYVFLEKPAEASKEFDAAIALGKVDGGAYEDAVAGKQSLAQK